MVDKIAILCSDDYHHDYMVGVMQATFRVAIIIREPGKAQRARIRRERPWVEAMYSEYHHLRRTTLGLDAYRRDYFRDVPRVPVDCEARQVVVPYINAPTVSALLNETGPDLTLIMGTSILKRDVLAAAGPRVINIHGGCLPYYRGNHCFFFALYHRDFGRIASTIHFVDAGIDTGDIVEVVVPPIDVVDNAETLYSRAEKMAIHRLVEHIRAAQNGREFPRTSQAFRGHLYRTKDRKVWHDVHHWIRRLTDRHRKALEAWKASTSGSVGGSCEANLPHSS